MSARCQVVEALNQEWWALVAGSHDVVAGWESRHPVLAGCRDVDEVLAVTRRDGDGVLSALLSEAVGGSPLAARAVLQAMLGKLVRMARTTPGAGIDDFVGALWCRIRSYPLARRPRRIAANLALDTLKDVTTAVRRDEAMTITPWPPGANLEQLLQRAVRAESVTASGVLAAAHRVGLIDRRTQVLMEAVYVGGLSSHDAGARLGTSPEMVRYRCSRAVRRLAERRLELLDVA